MRVRACLLAAATLFCLPVCTYSQSLFHFTEKPGSYRVGLKVVEQYDYSRTFRGATDDLGKPYVGERARPLQTLIWYPAEKANGNAMTVGDYGKLLASEINFGSSQVPPEWSSWIDGMAPTLNDVLWAVRDAPPVAGKFPVMIYAPSFGAMAWENADLCEDLASHGYVVVASPDMGATTRAMTMDIAGLNAQAADISFLIGFARTLPNTDVSKIAVAGFSWGGLSNLLAAGRDSRISVLVALDGSMRYFAGLAKEAGIQPKQMTIPLLYFTQGEISMENMELHHSAPVQTGPNVLNRWVHGDLITVHNLALRHTEHSSMYQRNESVWKDYPTDHKGDYDREDGIVGYAWMARYTWKFLDAYLKNDPEAMTFLKRTPAENGVPKHYMSTEFRPAEGVSASMQTLRLEMGRRGFNHAMEIYTEMLKEDKDFKPSEAELTEWANGLMAGQHFPEAVGLWKFAAEVYPNSIDAYEGLGETYVLLGQRTLAVETYRRLLEKHPDNEDAPKKLKELNP